MWNSIRNHHIQRNGWADIGYHFGIVKVNARYEVVMGRPLSHVGAHCRGSNHESIGVCFVGNFDSGPPDTSQLEAALPLLDWLVDLYGIIPGRLRGHFSMPETNTRCPGEHFPMEQLRRMIYG